MIRFTAIAVISLLSALSLQAAEDYLPEATFATFSILSTATATDSGIILSDPVIQIYDNKDVTITFLLGEEPMTAKVKVSGDKVMLNFHTNDLKAFFDLAKDWRIVETPSTDYPLASNF